ncbi:YwqJ-related putative deaminase [Actinoplanes oblitus]|uniref:YwqJ-related putative deaminase n=1 Tax=Actinoplanes oblitus TaxID=3040509 RepID=A0ABY8W551_9ACTN|nr:YwqJ-related putative deaminase [Actinoplanes oblitus]WIM92462.1 YwqJ-related putative deaminase [Actinoplanes oblitus]
MTAVTQADADERARRWIEEAAPGAEPVLTEFELGWVISARFPPGDPSCVPSVVLDRRTGEMTIGGTLPPSHIAEWYVRDFRPPPRPPRVIPQPRRFPAMMSRLTVGDRSWVALSGRSEAGLPPHPAVATFFEAMPPHYRERGCERSAEAAVFSRFLWEQENARTGAGRPRLTPPEMRELVRGARLETFRIREDGDPTGGTPVSSRLPVLLLLDFLGLSPDAAAKGNP